MDKELLEKAVTEQIESCRSFLAKLRRNYARGLLTEEDVYQRFAEHYWQAVKDVLNPAGLSCSVTLENLDRFLEDYRCHAEGKPLPPDGAGWLLYAPHGSGVRPGAAPPFAAEQFFRLTGAYGVGPDAFLPLPAGVPDPRASSVHRYADCAEYSIRFDAVNCPEFFADPDPDGKEFTLANEYGLKLAIRVEHAYRDGEKVPFRNYFIDKRAGQMAVSGTAEGYTSGRVRSFEIEKAGGSRIRIDLSLDMEDENTYFRFPLWKEYFGWLCDREDAFRRGLLSRFREEG